MIDFLSEFDVEGCAAFHHAAPDSPADFRLASFIPSSIAARRQLVERPTELCAKWIPVKRHKNLSVQKP